MEAIVAIQREMAGEKNANPFNANCRSREILEIIGSKWALLILCLLKTRPMRTGQMMRAIQSISQKMLTQTLRDLERTGVVERRNVNVGTHFERL